MWEYIMYALLIGLLSYMVWEVWRMMKREEKKYQEYLDIDRSLGRVVDEEE